ncbi:MAG: alpha/beta hydrolase [Gammaproteobacteria bacterium]|nr:alpha/beta hydrolase [Gammaproteobacteria bacterium]
MSMFTPRVVDVVFAKHVRALTGLFLLCASIGADSQAAEQVTPSQAEAAAALLASGSADVQPALADVDYLPNVVYANGKDLLDIYLPEGVERPPVVVFFHGGGLLGGDKSHARNLAARLLPLGVGVVSANYRLSPEATHPDHVEDAAASTAWVLSNIERFGADPQNVYVTGHSAGAYLAALLVLDPRYLAAHSVTRSALRGSILISPFLYVEETAPVRPKTVWGDDPQNWQQASVTPYVNASAPPMLLIYADGDDAWRREQIERFAAEMQAAGHRSVAAVEVPNRDHIRLMTELNDDDDEIGALVAQFMGQHTSLLDH